jgi:hypothetical protein
VIVPQANRGNTDNRKQHGNTAIRTADRGKSVRIRTRSNPYNIVAKRKIPHHTQYVAHG